MAVPPLYRKESPFFWYQALQTRKDVVYTDANVDYLGLLNLLRGLQARGLITQSEAAKIAARLKVSLGADIFILS